MSIDKGGFHKSDIDTYRAQAITAAEELRYPHEIIERIEDAKTEVEISNIMATARETDEHEVWGKRRGPRI